MIAPAGTRASASDAAAPEPGFARSMKAMLDLEDVWTDTRGALTPMLPRKPYPVLRVPPPVARPHRYGKKKTRSLLAVLL